MNKHKEAKSKSVQLDERFEFGQGGSLSERLAWQSKLWTVTGKDDGETYLLHLFRKTGSDIDQDLRRLFLELVRRMKGILAMHAARDVLVEVLDMVEDDAEFGLRFYSSGTPLSQLPSRSLDRLKTVCRLPSGRVAIWQQIGNLARGLGYLHSADIVHGGICSDAIIVEGMEPLQLKLGGFEGSIHVGSVETAAVGILKPGAIISVSRDWSDLGELAATLLGVGEAGGSFLLPSERRLLDRLRRPPQFERIDGASIAGIIDNLCSELAQIGSSGAHELVLWPARHVIRRDLPSITNGLIPANDTEGLLEFLKEDLNSGTILIGNAPKRPNQARVFTDNAFYNVDIDPADGRIGKIGRVSVRKPNDLALYANETAVQLHVSGTKREAHDRVLRTGAGALTWASINKEPASASLSGEPAQWHALILVEAFALLSQRLKHYPVEILPSDDPGFVTVVPRNDPDRDAWRKRLGETAAAAKLARDLSKDDGSEEWTLSVSDTLLPGVRAPRLVFVESAVGDQGRIYRFRFEGNRPESNSVFLRPFRDRGAESAILRRLRYIVSAQGNLDLLLALNDPESVALDDTVINTAALGEAPNELDLSKKEAWEAIKRGNSIDVVVGPPGVGKSFLVSRLVGSILGKSRHARILITAQNHDVLADMERNLNDYFSDDDFIIVRVERPQGNPDETGLRKKSRSILSTFTEGERHDFLGERYKSVVKILSRQSPESDFDSEAILRDTDHLLMRSADITLVTANSFAVEEMIAAGERFDWVIVEEAARASGPELVGPLLLGIRRLLIGDHHQLAPFDAERKNHFYRSDAAAALLEEALDLLNSFPELPEEVRASLEAIRADPVFLEDVLATGARFEQPFREIAERAEARSLTHSRSGTSMLTEQSRMHPTICKLVSETFYQGQLHSSPRVSERENLIDSSRAGMDAPIVVLDAPSLSQTSKSAFEEPVRTSLRNRSEAEAIIQALKSMRPTGGAQEVSLVILAPYAAQRDYLRGLISRLIDPETGRVSGFVSPKRDGEFVQTVDSFQGGEADLVFVSFVRNNQRVGPHALGFLGRKRRMNVLLSRARQKLVLVTSTRFLRNAVKGHDPGGERQTPLSFLGSMLDQIQELAADPKEASILKLDDSGVLVS